MYNMYKKNNSNRNETKIIYFSVAAAALSLLAANPKTVKADTSIPISIQTKDYEATKSYSTTKKLERIDAQKDLQARDSSLNTSANSQKDLQARDSSLNTSASSQKDLQARDSSLNTSASSQKDLQARDSNSDTQTYKWGDLDVTYKDKIITVPGTNSTDKVVHLGSIADIDGINKDDIQEVRFTDHLKIDSGYNMFKGLTNLTKITGLENLDTSAVKDMRYMFANCGKLTNLDLSSFDTANTSWGVEGMFQDCKNLQSIKLSPKFTIANANSMKFMFDGCSSLTALDLSKFDTSNVTNMTSTFRDCSSLTKLDLSSFDTSKVNDMMGMFNNCSNLKELDLRSFIIDPNIDKGYMLDGLAKLNTLKLGKSTYINDTHLNTSGTWVNIGNGKEDAPQANNKYLSEDLIAHADDILGDTYIRPGSPITVSYLDTSKRSLAPDISLKGKIGDDYKVTAKTIPGYIVKEVPDNATGVFTDQQQNVKFIYSVDPESTSTTTPIKAADVTVSYQDENGNQIAPETILQGNVGDGYTTGTVEIPDYTLKVRPENATGFFSTEPQSVTYIYARNNAIPEENDQNSPTNSSSNNPSQKGTSQTNESQNKHRLNKNGVTENYTIFKSSDRDSDSTNPVLITHNDQEEELPQTGTNERSQIIELLLGFLSVICSLLPHYFSKKKKG